MPFAVTWMDLETVILSVSDLETVILSMSDKDKYDIIYM